MTIDGVQVVGTAGETLLEVARSNNIEIPTLCHLDGLADVASCRLCLVEIGPAGRLVPACQVTIEEGMQITANNDRLHRYRRQIIEMLFTERNHVCAVCVANNDCELQDTAELLGLTHFDLEAVAPKLDVDATHDRFAIDHNRCILCLRCVRVCAEVEGAFTWGVSGRGIDTRVVTDAGSLWGASKTCTSCGKCVQVCPTGALFEKGRMVAQRKPDRPYLPFLQRRTEVATP
ncbi:2Fe-2S iron-sulfur cluster-binding protein [Dactylosporangium matsuzakiense]|uniref:2Fe-2S iron-sulfur cluster-binding protein n=1 Tax=Dactylosporangium matsuzakiense TaxID=53360 RepID=UPI0022F32279|nr:2Fe-2S iron-sulfur cluster-binding protein [Dactylosporangium matsuzakiense]